MCRLWMPWRDIREIITIRVSLPPLSRQFSDGRCLAEAMGGKRLGMSPEDMVRVCGLAGGKRHRYHCISLMAVLHQSASVRDWPPNIPQG